MKNAYQDKAEAQKEKWTAEFSKLKAQLKEATADVRITLQQKMDDLREKIIR